MEPIVRFQGRIVALSIENIDTDQIIPARYLVTTDKQGLGEALFTDWRYQPDGSPNPDFPLNRPESQGATVLVAGHNFGCGSSREHAPWALIGYGFRAVISTFFADIFRSNALKNGLLPIQVDHATLQRLFALAAAGPATLTVDLERQEIVLPDGQAVPFPIDPFARYCLLNGVDQLGFLLSQAQAVADFEQTHPIQVNTRAG